MSPKQWSLLRLVCVALASAVLAAPSDARAAVCAATELCSATANPCTIAGTRDVASGCHLDFGAQSVVLTGVLQSATAGGSFAVSAGNLALAAGRIRSVGATGWAGGNVTITVAGALVMSGSGPALDVGGAAGGGVLTVQAGSIDVRTGSIDADGTGSAACGGAISLHALSGPLLLAAPVHATGHLLCSGGQIEMSGQRVEIGAPINVSGGDYPGGISITADDGDLLLTAAASLRASGEQIDFEDGGDGGAITLAAEAGNVTLLGGISSDGGSPEGEGGSIVVLSGGSLQVGGALTVQGNGAESNGGVIEIDALGDVTFAANVRASGGSLAGGGEIDVRSDGIITVAAGKLLQANGGFFGGGTITLRDASSILMSGILETKASAGGNAGFSTLESCRTMIAGTLDAGAGGGGVSGANVITAGVITITGAGRLFATPCNPLIGSSCNVLTLSAGVPAIDPLAIVTPAPNVTVDPQLHPCCGNATLEPGETCDDGNEAACDGCSGLCQLETQPPCPSDGNECTADCTPDGGCTYKPRTGQACTEDGDSCTSDVCSASAECRHLPRVCNDGLDCTIDACTPGVGCVATPDDARCDDDESCTSEACHPTAGCVYDAAPDGTTCNDRDLCTTDDACSGGACLSQSALNCDDGDACTLDACLPKIGCHSQENPAACPCGSGAAAMPAGSPCVDGNECSQGDRCDGTGVCLPGPICPDDGSACTGELCLPVGASREICLALDNQCATSCVGQSDGTPCSDQSACTTGTCQGDSCVSLPIPCGDGDRCTGIDYCVDVVGCRSSAPPLDDPLCELPSAPLDAFTCYRAKASRSGPRLTPLFGVPFEDRFAAALSELRKNDGLCLPTSIDDADPAATTHPDKLARYLVRIHDAVPSTLPRTSIEVVNQLGTVRIDLKRFDGVLLPSALSSSTLPGPPLPPDPDRFGCYKVSLTLGQPKFLPMLGVALDDQFGALTVDVKRPTRLCTPLDLNGQDPGAPGHAAQLLCYQVRTSSGTPRFVARSGIFLGNELGAEQLDAVALEELCVPSLIDLP